MLNRKRVLKLFKDDSGFSFTKNYYKIIAFQKINILLSNLLFLFTTLI